MVDTSEFHQCLPEFGDEDFIMVIDDLFGAAILTIPFIKKEEGKVFCHDGSGAQNDLYICVKLICHCDNGIKPSSFGRGPTKSIATKLKCVSGIASGCNGPGGFEVVDLLCWQSGHLGT